MSLGFARVVGLRIPDLVWNLKPPEDLKDILGSKSIKTWAGSVVKPLIFGFSFVLIESNGLLKLALAVFGASIWFNRP
jgi:hypothetical protein